MKEQQRTQKLEDLIAFQEGFDKLVLKSKTFKRICDTFQLNEKRVLDIGCGVGAHMQRFGKGSVGITTNPNEVTLGHRIGRDIRLGNAERLEDVLQDEKAFDVIWCNNIFEHLLSPHAFLVYLKQYASAETMIILGTPMVPTPSTLMKLRPFRGALATAHVNFFTKETYRLTAEFAGWKVLNLSSYYFSSSILNSLITPVSPHLYLVAQNNTDYAYHQKKLKEWVGDDMYEPLIQIMNKN